MKLRDLSRLVALATDNARVREALLISLLRLHPLLKVIANDDKGLYLVRHYLLHVMRHRLPGVYLHFINRSDADRELHNHPWDTAASVILWGGYVEQRVSLDDDDFRHVLCGSAPVLGIASRWVPVTRTFGPGDLNVLDKRDFHRLTLTSRFAVTLFVSGRRSQEWGFLDTATGQFETEEEREARLAPHKLFIR